MGLYDRSNRHPLKNMNSQPLDPNRYVTTDLYFAAHLMALKVPMVGTEKKDKRVHFIFSTANFDVEALKNQYFNDSPARRFADAIKSLKSMVHLP